MSLLLALLGGAPVAPDQIWPEETDIVSIGLDSEDTELSFTYGPLPDDVIAAVDLLVNVFDDAHEADETDYSFTLTLLDDAQLYAAQFETEEAPDDTDHSFVAGPLSDDFVAPDEKVYGLQADDDQPTDETDYSFTFTLLDDAQVYGLGLEADVTPTDEIEYDFSLSLQDDFVVVADEPPYQHFDDYDDAFEGDEYSFYLGNVSDYEAAVESLFGGGGWSRKGMFRLDKPEQEQPEKTPLEVVKIGKADKEIITGLVVPKIRTKQTRPEVLERLAASQFNAAKIRGERLRRLQMADDEWLMTI
jgi:hypothetical protein